MNPSSSKQYYPALDGLRGAAILLVILLHNFGFINYFFFGWLGVDLFFVLSGFLITDILLNSVDKPHYLRNFYIKRILRIFPVYYLLLIICFFILPHITNLNQNLDYYKNNQLWLWTYLQNWLYVFREPFGSKMLLHIWSLAVEEQFYLVWPITILLIRKPKVLLVIVATVLFIVAITRFILWSYHIEYLAYSTLYTYTRIDGICIGCMLALMLRINPELLKKYTPLIVLGLAALNFGFYFFNAKHSNTIPYLAFVGYTTFAIMFGLLVNEAVSQKSKIIDLIFNNRILKFFGKISYGLYMYHLPVYIILFGMMQKTLSGIFSLNEKTLAIVASLVITAISILLSLLSYQYFEKPFLRLKRKYE